jgi:hypothetical protein
MFILDPIFFVPGPNFFRPRSATVFESIKPLYRQDGGIFQGVTLGNRLSRCLPDVKFFTCTNCYFFETSTAGIYRSYRYLHHSTPTEGRGGWRAPPPYPSLAPLDCQLLGLLGGGGTPPPFFPFRCKKDCRINS